MNHGPGRPWRPSRWRWPAVWVLALGLLVGGAVGIPRSWLELIFPPGRLSAHQRRTAPRPWLVLVPPPELVAVPTPPEASPQRPPEPPPPAPDPRWWRNGWQVRVADAAVLALQGPRPTADDSVAYLLETLGLERDLLARVRPDSVLAVHLLLLEREDSYRMDELKPYFEAVSRARSFRDMQSRKADMYDDHLGAEIMVPD